LTMLIAVGAVALIALGVAVGAFLVIRGNP
jgi:hypothetical protein